MRLRLLLVLLGVALAVSAGSRLRADQLELLNGDHYTGKVVSLTEDSVVLNSEVLGKITVPRSKVASLSFGTNAVAAATPATSATAAVPTNLPTAATLAALAKSLTNGTTSARLPHKPAAAATTNAPDADMVAQIRAKMLAGSPEAAGKYNEMVTGLLNGSLSVSDLQRQAKESADQIRELKRQLGPDADDALDGYLEILDNFVKESSAGASDSNHP